MNMHPHEMPYVVEGPQPLVRPVPPGAPYPVQELGPLREPVEAVEGVTLAPLAIPAQSALAVASLAVQGFADVETLGGYAPLSLFCLTIAQSGERKSSCDGLLMAPLHQFERDQLAAYRDELNQARNAQALWKGERDKILTEAKSKQNLKRIEAQADLDALGLEPTAPPSPDRLVTEPTFEGLTRLFVEGQSSLGVFSDEGGQFIGGHAMNSDNRLKTVAALNSLWDGAAIRRTRAGDGSTTLHGRRLAVHLMGQPEAVQPLLSDPQASGTGFLARFLITQPASTIGTRLSGKMRRDERPLEGFAGRLRNILETPMPLDSATRALRPRQLPLSRAARELLVAYSDEVEREQAPDGRLAHVTGPASKSGAQAARIAAVLTLWDDLRTPEVPLWAMEHGIALARFYLGEAVRLAEAATVSAEINRADRLRVWLLKDWPRLALNMGRDPCSITPSDILRQGPNPLRERPVVVKLIVALVEAGWLDPLPNGTIIDGKARKLAYRVVRD